MISNCVNNVFDGAQSQLYGLHQMLAINSDDTTSIPGKLIGAIVVVPIEFAVEIVRHVAIAIESAVFAVISFLAIPFGFDNATRYTLQNLHSVFYNLALAPCKAVTSMILVWPKILSALLDSPPRGNYDPQALKPAVIANARRCEFDKPDHHKSINSSSYSAEVYVTLPGTQVVDLSSAYAFVETSSTLFSKQIIEYTAVMRKQVIEEVVDMPVWDHKEEKSVLTKTTLNREIDVMEQIPLHRVIDIRLSFYGHFIEIYDHNAKCVQGALYGKLCQYAGANTPDGEDAHIIRSRLAGIVVATIDTVLEVVRPLFLAISCLVLATLEFAFTAVAIASSPITVPFGFPYMIGDPKPEHQRGRFENSAFSFQPIDGLLEFSAMSLKHTDQAAEYIAQAVANSVMSIFNWIPQVLSALYDPQEARPIFTNFYSTPHNAHRLSLNGWETNAGGFEMVNYNVNLPNGTEKTVKVMCTRGPIHWMPSTEFENQKAAHYQY